MGPGIFTTHSKKVLGGCAALLAVILAVMAYYAFRSPVGGVSPYETVNDLFEQEKIIFTSAYSTYPTDVEVVEVTIRNDTEDTVVAQAPGCENEWLLETRVDGAWHTMRLDSKTTKRHLKWDFPAEEYTPDSGPSGVVKWNGGEQTYLCRIREYYSLPLDPGLYRIVFPEMEHRNVTALAVEFEVR